MGLSRRVRSNQGLTSGGSTVTGTTLLKNIDGYTDWEAGDTITLSGKDASNATVNSAFTITETSTVEDLLNAIQTAYGGSPAVSASLSAEGEIQVTDNSATAASNVRVVLTRKSSFDLGSFGTTGTIVAARTPPWKSQVSRLRNRATPLTKLSRRHLNLLKADADTTYLARSKKHQFHRDKINDLSPNTTGALFYH